MTSVTAWIPSTSGVAISAEQAARLASLLAALGCVHGLMGEAKVGTIGL